MLDPTTTLKWNMLTNNCQKLIDRLLNSKDFEYVFPRLPSDFRSIRPSEEWKHFTWPRYLISFGDRVEGRDISIQQPNSCVAKFCEKIRSTEDIIDFLEREFGRREVKNGNPLFEYLKELALVTPQPNVEDYLRTADDALWDLPRDSLSILQHHLLRPFTRYSTVTGRLLDEDQWTKGRLRLLKQLDTIACYTGALGSALLDMFYREPDMISQITIPKSRIFGSLRSDEKVRLIRSSDMVHYIITQRQEHSTWSDDVAERMCKAIQRTSERYLRCAGTKVFNSRMFRWMLSDILKNTAEQLGPLGGHPTDHLTDYWEALQIFRRDNWVYLRLGKSLLIAHQIFRKSKNVRGPF
ncbi:MAG: hypothetical protein LQ349_005673 [Xanthoria aureola]|nr:MAG: hypothetical protein LQ349_005673 [Xanthoria aureola]